MASHDQGAAESAPRQLTSFSFLSDKDDAAEPAFAFGVGDFFSKVRSVLAPGAAKEEDVAEPQESSVPPQWAAVRTPREADAVSLSLPSREGSVKNEAVNVSRAPGVHKNGPPRTSRKHRQAPSLALKSTAGAALASSAVASITPAVALTSNHFSYLAGAASMADASMMVEDGMSTLGDSPSMQERIARDHGDMREASDEEGDEGDVLGSLHTNRMSGYGLGLQRTSSLPSFDSFASGLRHISSIPGFPLSRETLADDARSVHSVASTRFRGGGKYEFEASSSDFGGRGTPTNSAAVHGLQTSADAIWRRIKGEGLSKKFWMADEHVKECRECLASFTPFRRKHHCRLCGQIYCSRCASHIISGGRFGTEGMIRVCNFCMRMLEEYDAEDGVSTAGGMHAHHDSSLARRPTLRSPPPTANRVLPGMISAPLEAQVKAPQSQFAANHLFARAKIKSDRGISHGAVASILQQHEEEARLTEAEDEADLAEDSADHDVEATSPQDAPPAPFRKALKDEPSPTLEAEEPIPDSEDMAEHSVSQERPHTPSVRPSLATQAAVSHALNIPFPEAADAADLPSERDTAAFYKTDVPSDPRVRLVGEGVARQRTRLRSRLDAVRDSEAPLDSRLSSTRKDSLLGFYQEPTSASWQTILGDASLAHLNTMARQTLQYAKIKDVDEWTRIIIPLALKAINRVRPNVRAGEGMGIRGYVKIKRVPGGVPSDTQYVDGFVCSKHVATKKMAQSLPLSHARVMVIQFPIEFHRPDTQFVSLEPVIAQEQEYTRILVARILALRPQLLIVEKTVSRLALQLLEEAGVIVVWSLKPSAVDAISRCTQADIITSVDRLALEPRLGRVTAFDVQQYKIVGAPEASKSLMRIEGLNRNLGSTILLRGAGGESLRRIKVILDLLIFVAYNLRLEEHMMRDENAVLQLAHDPDEEPAASAALAAAKRSKAQAEAQCFEGEGLSARTQRVLHMYDGMLVSASAAVKVPPPYPLARMKEISDRLRQLKSLCDEEEVAQIRAEELRASVALTPMTEKTAAEGGLDAALEPKQEPDLQAIMQKPAEVGRRVEFESAKSEFKAQLRSWEEYLDRCPDAVTPFAHQRLVMLAVTACSGAAVPCSPPSLHQVDFYGFGDETLGQFLERHCNDAGRTCENEGCGRENLLHYRSYVHNDTRVQVMMERFVCPIPGSEGRLLVWSYCKECGVATSVSPVSEETWAYSFAKYLELHFYAADNCRTPACGHHFFRDHVRYFAYRNLAIRFHADPIQTMEVSMPSLHLQDRPDIRCKVKNDEAVKLQQRSTAYWKSVLARLEALGIEVAAERDPAAKQKSEALLADLMAKYKDDSAQIQAALLKAYSQSPTNTALPLNAVARQLQDKVVQWDMAFVDFERSCLPLEKDVRRMTTTHLKRIFSDREGAEKLGERLSVAAELDEHAGESSSRSEGIAQGPKSARSGALEGVTHVLSPARSGTPSASTTPPAGMDDTRRLGDTSADESAIEKIKTRLQMTRPSAFDDSSCTENEISSTVSGLVRRFESPIEPSSAAEGKSSHVARRPPMRRLKSEQVASPSKFHLGPEGAQSDNEDVRSPTPKSESLTPTMSRRSSARESGLPRATGGHRVRSTQKRLGPEQSALPKATAPPSSYRPPRISDPPRPRHMRGSSSRSGSTIRKPPTDDESTNGGSTIKAKKDGAAPSRLPVSTRKETARSKVSTIARHFDRISREAERERDRQRQVMAARARRARPVAFTQAKVEVFRSVRDAVKDDDSASEAESEGSKDGDAEDEDEDGSDSETQTQANGSSSFVGQRNAPLEGQNTFKPEHRSAAETMAIDLRPDSTRHEDASSVTSAGQSLISSTLQSQARSVLLSDGESSGFDRGSLMKAISGFWTVRGGEPVPLLEYPLLATEHVFADSQIIVREDEPSSIIAFTLSSKNYSDKLKSLQSTASSAAKQDPDESGVGGDVTAGEGWNFVRSPAAEAPNDLEAAMKRPGGTHFRFEFESGPSSFWCRIFFAEQFDALRRSSGCSEMLIESLSRCLKWDSSGGKSGAAFLKTRDDRLVVKQLSRYEMDGFSKFAPAYFDYMANCFYRNRPTTLAKIFGCFRIGFKNPQTGKALKMDCLVMENLFYGRETSKIFDLKGSMRNRHVEQTGKPNEVLQDVNLVEMAHQNPIFVREHSKRLLRAALWNDSLFLADMNVMDYSLVVGMDNDKPELVVGIIDFVRTYTWDKRVESFVKEAGLLGGTGKGEPTIITPRQYRNRFLAFLDRSFVMTPDAWLPSTWAQQ